MYKVLIIDTDSKEMNTLPGLIDWAACNLQVVAVMSDLDQALQFMENNNVDILVMKVSFPQANGIEFLQQIRSRQITARCIFLSNFADFSYVQKAIPLGIENYLLTPVDPQFFLETLQQTVRKLEKQRLELIQSQNSSQMLRISVLYRWILGDISQEELEARFSDLGIAPEPEGYTVALLHTLSVRDRLTPDIRKQLLALCNATLPSAWHIPAFYDLDKNIVFIIPTSQLEGFLPALRQVVEQVCDLLAQSVHICVGSQERTASNLRISYETAKQTLSPYLIGSASPIVFYSEDVQSWEVPPGHGLPSVLLSESFDQLLLDRKYRQCQEYLDLLFSETTLSSGVAQSVLRSYVVKIVVCVINALRSHNIDVNKLVGDSSTLFYKIINFQDMNEMYAWTKDFLSTSVDVLELKHMRFSPCISRIVDYIEQHYAQDICLKTISNELNINAAYLGQLFKSETGQLFSAYLNRVRIEAAQKLLEETSLSLNDISVQCGYVNISYFYNIFKKHTGKTPSQYRKASN